jgi:2-pyrone-4,6-dicarboxylate lactonase
MTPIPDGAVDVHAHVMTGPSTGVPGAAYAPFEAPVGDYLAHLDGLGLAAGVLVTPSAYGTDNAVLVDALATAPERLRGVAVVGDGDDLAALDRAGVRAVRVQDRFAGGAPVSALPDLLRRSVSVGDRPWHVEVWTDPREHLDVLAAGLATGRVLLDHLGMIPAPAAGRSDPAIPVLRTLLGSGDCWVTLSGAYRLAPGAPETDAAERLSARVEAVLDAAPDRVVWGSDWPYVAAPGPAPTPDDHRAVLDLWLPDRDVRRQVLVDNPRRLYGLG